MNKQVSAITILLILVFSFNCPALAESGYKTWLRYEKIDDIILRGEYIKYCNRVIVTNESEILTSALNELKTGLDEMLGVEPQIVREKASSGIILGTLDNIPSAISNKIISKHRLTTPEGFMILTVDENIVITAKSDVGILYGTFHFLRLLQMEATISDMNLYDNPKIKLRILNHWDNPGKISTGHVSIERGYGGNSIFLWDELPKENFRYFDYARMLASVGINGTVINNVNTAGSGFEGWKLLTPEYLPKLKSLASVFRKYGVKLYISVNFFSPVLISEFSDADPFNPKVQKWWKDKVAEIYSEIPDFGGFLVKADSEGQPGPMKYGRNHADGANLLADALKPFGGILMWRAFVYGKDLNLNSDRAFQAYEIFKPLDGRFADNVLVQIKNGPIDFQVREPVSSLFGAMPKTNQILELQITQEYTGHDKHVCYLVPQWKEILDFDTYAKGKNSTVSKIVDGSLFGYKYAGIAGVSNIGDDNNWTGHHLAQANFYGFGRLAWNPDLLTEQITHEWITQTLGHNKKVISVTRDILHDSWKTYENYTSPLGVGLMCNRGGAPDHFYPAPSIRVDYHQATQKGVGFDRTMATGSGYTGQYFEPVRSVYENLATCPDELLLFFHHVPYTHKLHSGKTVIQHIYDSHNEGVMQVKNYRQEWQSLKGLIDDDRFEHVANKLKQQIGYAEEWRDSINTYFSRLSKIKDISK